MSSLAHWLAKPLATQIVEISKATLIAQTTWDKSCIECREIRCDRKSPCTLLVATRLRCTFHGCTSIPCSVPGCSVQQRYCLLQQRTEPNTPTLSSLLHGNSRGIRSASDQTPLKTRLGTPTVWNGTHRRSSNTERPLSAENPSVEILSETTPRAQQIQCICLSEAN